MTLKPSSPTLEENLHPCPHHPSTRKDVFNRVVSTVQGYKQQEALMFKVSVSEGTDKCTSMVKFSSDYSNRRIRFDLSKQLLP